MTNFTDALETAKAAEVFCRRCGDRDEHCMCPIPQTDWAAYVPTATLALVVEVAELAVRYVEMCNGNHALTCASWERITCEQQHIAAGPCDCGYDRLQQLLSSADESKGAEE